MAMAPRTAFRASGYQGDGRKLGMPLPEKPWMPAPYDDADISAAKAVRNGHAAPEQQQRFMAWLIECACRAGTSSYDEAHSSNRDFNEGCRHVGNQVLKLANMQTKGINEEQGR